MRLGPHLPISAWLAAAVDRWLPWRPSLAQKHTLPADPARNPYVYAHTSPDVLRLVPQVNEAAAAQPAIPRV